jgi:hypothetical protein
MNINELMKLNNVLFSDNTLNTGLPDGVGLKCRDKLVDVVWELVDKNPAWRFRARTSQHYTGEIQVDSFDVLYEGEKIGHIGMSFYRRNYVLSISGGRLASYDCIRTKDVHKAITLAKKNFKRKSVSDLLDVAGSAASGVINQIYREKSRVSLSNLEILKPYMQSFVLETKQDEFAATLVSYPAAAEALASLPNANTELDIAARIRTSYEANKYNLVLITKNSSYIVKFADDSVNIYDDGNFPEDLRGKLGLLKLVTAGQMVDEVGCRIDDETFVLVKEEQC